MFIRFLLLILVSNTAFSANEATYSKKFTASDLSDAFFGPAKSKDEKMKMALNVGRINLAVNSRLNCGAIDLKGNFNAEFKKLNRQVLLIKDQIAGIIQNPQSLSIAVICYMQKNVCSHIRHFSALFQRELDLQFNACNSIDQYIDDQASKGQKQQYAEAFKKCVGDDVTPERIRHCKNASVKSRNLLKPFDMAFTSQSQNVLESVLTVVQKQENYLLWSRLLGEVKLSSSGFYKPLFPNDMLKVEDFSHNVEVEARRTACNTKALSNIISRDNFDDNNMFNHHLRQVIKDKLTKTIVFDLESLPIKELSQACTSLGESIAALALNRVSAEGKSDLSAALNNDALSEDLKDFYQNKAQKTFSAIEARVKSGDVKPLSEVVSMIHSLAKEYRQINREEASGITARREINNQNKTECVDQLSCEKE